MQKKMLFFYQFKFAWTRDVLMSNISYFLLNKKQSGIKNAKLHTKVQRDEPCASPHIRFANQK